MLDMKAWLAGCNELFEDEELPQRSLLLHILKGQHIMALALKTLQDNAAVLATDVTGLDTAVKALIALHTDPADQAAVDALATALAGTASSVKALTDAVNAIVAPAPTPAPAA